MEIVSKLGVAKSTLSKWFQGVDFSEDIKKNLTSKAIEESTIRIQSLNKKRGDLLSAYYERADQEAVKELNGYKASPLFVSALALYWGEGDKTSKGHIRITNTDPKLLHLFKHFLISECGVPEHKIKGALFIYKDLDDDVCREFWRKNIGIQHFHKTMVLPSRHKTKKLPYGTCMLVVSNTYLKRKLMYWIDQLPEMVLNTVPKKKRP